MSRKRKNLRVLISGYTRAETERFAKIFKSSGTEVDYQYDIRFVNSLEASKKIFHEFHPDLCMIDIFNEYGKDFCLYMRENEFNRHTGVVFSFSRDRISDSGKSDQLVECLEIGADDFIRLQSSSRELMARVKAVLRLKVMTDELRSVNHKLEVLSMTDELTGLANMRHFSKKLEESVVDCQVGKHPLGILMFDLDHFKAVNDSTNHLIGSFVIAEIGKIIEGCGVLVKGDMAARYGGDEFICLLKCRNEQELKEKGELVRKTIANHSFSKDGTTIQVTASIGLSLSLAGSKFKSEDLVKASDYMLYKSKLAGRNKVNFIMLSDFKPEEHSHQQSLTAQRFSRAKTAS